jgi:hypothetical protein
LHARKNSEVAHHSKTFDNTFSPRNLVSEARKEVAIMDTEQYHPKLKSSFGKPYTLTTQQIVDICLKKEAFGIEFYNPRNLIINPK